MSAYVVVMSDHKHPKWFVARKMIGNASYAVICVTRNETQARQIADAMTAANRPSVVVPLKRKRA